MAGPAIPILMALVAASTRKTGRGGKSEQTQTSKRNGKRKIWVGKRLVEVDEGAPAAGGNAVPPGAPTLRMSTQGGFADRLTILGDGSVAHMGPQWWQAKGQALYDAAIEQYTEQGIELTVDNLARGLLAAAAPAFDWDAYARNENATPAVDSLVMRVRQRVARALAQRSGTVAEDGTLIAGERERVFASIETPESDPLAEESFVPGHEVHVAHAPSAPGAMGAHAPGDGDGDGEQAQADDVAAEPAPEPPAAEVAEEVVAEPEPEPEPKRSRRGSRGGRKGKKGKKKGGSDGDVEGGAAGDDRGEATDAGSGDE